MPVLAEHFLELHRGKSEVVNRVAQLFPLNAFCSFVLDTEENYRYLYRRQVIGDMGPNTE